GEIPRLENELRKNAEFFALMATHRDVLVDFALHHPDKGLSPEVAQALMTVIHEIMAYDQVFAELHELITPDLAKIKALKTGITPSLSAYERQEQQKKQLTAQAMARAAFNSELDNFSRQALRDTSHTRSLVLKLWTLEQGGSESSKPSQ
ncbi:MAG: hypothetical protein AB1540_14050, partial [Bdellovibrionota bacterium]